MTTFDEFVLSWWNNFLDNTTEETAKRIMENEFIGEEETVDDYIGITEDCEAQTCREWLGLQDDANQIYSIFFGYDSTSDYSAASTEDFLEQMFMENAGWYAGPSGEMPSFAEEFVKDMAYHAAGYSNPLGFFEDLQNGCQSGMIGILIYNADCKEIYIKHIDDMEEYKSQLEDGMGEPIKNRTGAPHYTFMCWLCYEELGYNIARELFPETF